jgi:VanZ family protein
MLSMVKNRLSLLLFDRENPLLGIICILLTTGIVIACLWPFNFHPANKVEWINDGNGITFQGQAIVFSSGPLAIPETSSKNESIAIELFVQPHMESRYNLASLLTVYDRDLDQIIIGQWRKELIIRARSEHLYSQKHYHEIGVENALQKNATHLITITSGRETTKIYVDGNLEKSAPHYSLISEGLRLSGQLVLGNSPEGTQSWNGTFLGLAIYGRSLNSEEVLDHYHEWQMETKGASNRLSAGTLAGRLNPLPLSPIAFYLFDEHGGDQILDHSGNQNHLQIPADFHRLRKIILGLPAKDQWFSHSNLMDIAINIIGFMPFGFLLHAWLRKTDRFSAPLVCGITILLGFSLSLTVELIQAYLPARDSSFLDVISNTVGTVVGILLLHCTISRLHHEEP